MAKLDKTNPVNLQELIVSSLAMTDALAKLLIEKGLVTRRVPPQRRPPSKVIRGFDSPDLWFHDTLTRIKALEQRIDEYDREIESRWKSKE